MWKLPLILFLAAFCNAQEIGNINKTLGDPMENNDNTPKAEISTVQNIPNNEEIEVPFVENNISLEQNPTENKINEQNKVNPNEDKILKPKPEDMPAYPDNLKPEDAPVTTDDKPKPPETLALSEVEPIPVVIPNIPEVILVSGEPVPIAIVSNGPVIISPEPELRPDLSICQKRNSYFKVDGKCDAYIECREFIPRDMMCPDGMHYNPEAKWPGYPCGYPIDVSCTGRGVPQQANPTEKCPHRYGFYPPLEISAKECGRYRMCVDGNSVDMMCGNGLAFNPDNNRCDWPENVASCDAEAFLGFKCPPHPRDPRGNPLKVVLNFRHENDCHVFFSCKEGKARLLSCDLGFAFDPAIGKCVDSELVTCPYDPKSDPSKIIS